MELNYPERAGAVIKLSRKVGTNGEDGAASRDPCENREVGTVIFWLLLSSFP